MVEEGSLEGNWDKGRLRQLISNLVGNALQHGREDGVVQVSIADAGAMIRITVHNEGNPIPPDKLATIFDPLVRSRSPGSNRLGSIGLGLYIAREVPGRTGDTLMWIPLWQGGPRLLPRSPGSTPRQPGEREA